MRPNRILARGAVVGLLALGSLLPPGWLADFAAYPWLGLIPGLLAVDLLGVGGSRLARWGVGFAAAPLIATLAGWGLLSAGVGPALAARSIAWSAAILWLVAAAFPRRDAEAGTAEPDATPVVWWIAIGLAIVVLAPPLLNRYVAVRGDTWTHAGIVMQVLERGIPPEDPRFAGIRLHYVWFYNLFIALLCSLRGGGPFSFMTGLNFATAFATIALVSQASLRLARRPEAANGAAALTVFGLNAGAYLLWPLGFLRALAGQVRGENEVATYVHTLHWGQVTIIANLCAPFSYMVSFLDKLVVGSPLGYAYLLMILHMWALLRWLDGGGRRDLLWIAAGAAGMMLFHGVVALSVIPVWLGTLLLAILLRTRIQWLPSAGRLAGGALATLAGALLTTPYMLAAASGWESKTSGLRHSYIAPDVYMQWTLLTAGAVVWWFAWRPGLEAWRERRPLAAVVSLELAAMIAFACVVRLPEHNQAKFAFQAFVPGVLLAAPSFGSWLQRAIRGGPARGALLVLLFLVPAVITLHGFIVDPGRLHHPSVDLPPGAAELDRWIRDRTPRSAVVVDARFNELLMVTGRRPLYLGTSFGPERAAFPLEEVVERRRVTADIYGPARQLAEDVAALERLERPIYLVFRPEDDRETAGAWSVLAARRDRFELVYERQGYRVLRLIPSGKKS